MCSTAGLCVLQVAWAGNHTLASASEKDNVVRMYNFDTEDNYVLNLEQDSGLVSRVVALAYDERWGRGARRGLGAGRWGQGAGGAEGQGSFGGSWVEGCRRVLGIDLNLTLIGWAAGKQPERGPGNSWRGGEEAAGEGPGAPG